MQAHSDRLREGGLAESHRVRNWNCLFRLANERLTKAAVNMRRPHRAAVKAHVQTLVSQALPAKGADTARQARIDGHALADSERGHVLARPSNDARDLVPQDHRMTDLYRSESAVVVIVKVRSADAPDLDLHPHIVSTERLVRHLLITQVLGGMDDDGFHWS